jgi:hypothetical protein
MTVAAFSDFMPSTPFCKPSRDIWRAREAPGQAWQARLKSGKHLKMLDNAAVAQG